MKNLILLSTILLLFSSCSSLSVTSRKRPVNLTDANATNSYVDVKVDYDEVIVYTEEFKGNDKLNALKIAYHNALISNEIDVLVDPIYARKRKASGEVVVTVYGYGGSFTNQRTGVEFAADFAAILSDLAASGLEVNETVMNKILDVMLGDVSIKSSRTSSLSNGLNPSDCKRKKSKH